ncbi:MAG TPA: nucleotidyl transferase AbiEii/AbiGii toxin family protein [Polyangia bacterium]|jgi:hypothetical protein
MDSSAPSRLTPLQRELLEAFFARDQGFFLTGGAALAGFYLGHRETDDLDLFGPPDLELDRAVRALAGAAAACGAGLRSLQHYPEFRRFIAERGDERCVVDLAIDRAPAVVADKIVFGAVRVDSLREIAANKVCTLIGRAEIKDLVDLQALLAAGVELGQALDDAARKDAGVDPATLAWILDQVTITAAARLPGGTDPGVLDAFRRDLVRRLRALAFASVR